MWSLMDGDKKGSVGSATFQHRYPLDWGQKASELRGNKALWTHVDTCGHMWTLSTTSTQFGHKPGTAHSTHQHSMAQGFDFLQGLPAVDYWCAPQCPLANRHWERGSYNLHISSIYLHITIFIGTLCVRHTDGFELRLLHNRNRWCAFLRSTFAMLMTLITFWYFLQHFLTTTATIWASHLVLLGGRRAAAIDARWGRSLECGAAAFREVQKSECRKEQRCTKYCCNAQANQLISNYVFAAVLLILLVYSFTRISRTIGCRLAYWLAHGVAWLSRRDRRPSRRSIRLDMIRPVSF